MPADEIAAEKIQDEQARQALALELDAERADAHSQHVAAAASRAAAAAEFAKQQIGCVASIAGGSNVTTTATVPVSEIGHRLDFFLFFISEDRAKLKKLKGNKLTYG